MPVTPTYPGVYVQELPSGVRTIVGVGTSIGLFIGRAKRGPLFRPVLCTSYADFVRSFSEDTSLGQMPHYVRLFFLNGGTQCHVMRIANGAIRSGVVLRNEANTDPVLQLTARDPGVAGEDIRAVVTYTTTQPEATFNLDLFRWEVQNGIRVRRNVETWPNLSMDVNSPLYAPAFLNQNSKLVIAAEDPGAPAVGQGFSQSGRPVPHNAPNASFIAAWQALIGGAATPPGAQPKQSFQVSVDGSPYVEVDLVAPPTPLAVGTPAATATDIENIIATRFAALGMAGTNVAVSFETGPTPAAGGTTSTLLRITSVANGDVYIRPAGAKDLTAPLMLGTEQGGLEVSANAARRPAPNGLTFGILSGNALRDFAALEQQEIDTVNLEENVTGGGVVPTPVAVNLETVGPTEKMFSDGTGPSSLTGNSAGVREKFGIIAAAITTEAAADPFFPWNAQLRGYRLSLLPERVPEDNYLISAVFSTENVANPPGTDISGSFTQNVKLYTLGAGGLGVGGFQVAGATGSDGTAPLASDYDAAYEVADREVDLFNLLVLPPDAQPAVPVEQLYPLASVFCQRRRALLLMDAPESWIAGDPTADAATGVNALRIGLVKDYAALFYPRITVNDRGKALNIGPSGSIAGLMARIDGTRGVWKAPAGTEADLRGVIGLEYKFSDGQNGVLNPRAINTLRVFPNGIVNWGARTMDGDDSFGSEYKYIPIRRLALFIEESLYRGLTWVVFEPNDEPLWAQIRLNVGAFMHDLFRKGAFQGATPRDAYFVRCDSSTTTQTDRNLGIVNIIVGFAPLKPAEFVILYLQQMAGQIEV